MQFPPPTHLVAYPGPPVGPPDIVFLTEGIEDMRRVLAAAIGMEDDTRRWSTPVQGHAESVGDQAGPHVRADGPPDNFPGVQFNDGGHYVESKCPLLFWFALTDLDDGQEGWRW